MQRVFAIADHTRPNDTSVERIVVAQSAQTAVVVWHLLPGQEIEPHYHPHGQDTWVVISGEADYVLGGGAAQAIKAGDIAIAGPGETHGARNRGAIPFVFASTVSPAEAGFEPTEG